MVAPGFLQTPRVREWLNGIEPAWMLLDFDSFNALRHEPSRDKRAIRLAVNTFATDIAASPVASNTLTLLHLAEQTVGLKLTATGNLSRAIVAEMRNSFKWPDYDKTEAFVLHRVINEPDFLPLHFVRLLCGAAGLLRRSQGSVRLTQVGRRVLTGDGQSGLQALLFHIAFWHTNLAYFDRIPLQSWPQSDIGIVLWSLSTSAFAWETPEHLMRLSTVPVIGVLEAKWDFPTMAFEARILRPLTWFGLLEMRHDDGARPGLVQQRRYRKTPCFDRLISFEVQLEEQPTIRH
jgi:hypothetical protein